MTTSPNERPGCLGAILVLLGISKKEPADGEGTSGPLPYRLRDDFLSPAELSFYRVLRDVVGERATVLAKVNLRDLFYVTRPNEHLSFINRIATRHVDFLLCRPDTLRPLAGIELDDSSHREGKRQERDAFVERVFAASGLPLLRVPVKHAYTRAEIEGPVAEVLPGAAAVAAGSSARRQVTPAAPQAEPSAMRDMASDAPAPAGTTSSPPLCPKCGVPMVIRTARRGANAGQRFYGCPNYPRCRQVLPIE